MKKRTFVILLSLICALCFAFGLAACNESVSNNSTNSSELNNNQTESGNSNTDYTNSDNTEQSNSESESGNNDTSGEISDTDSDSGDGSKGDEDEHSHTSAEIVKENEVSATCTENGSYDSVVYCSICGEELSRETITVYAVHTPATAVEENIIEATCTASGSYDSVVYCSVCGEELSRESVIIQITEHTYNETYEYDTNGHWQICTVCGTATESESHTLSNGICTVCGFEKTSEGLSFTLSTAKTYYSVGGIGSCTDTDIVIPSTYKDLPVKAISNSAFNGNTSITSITIPDSVTSIGDYAFKNCISLKSVTIGEGVTKIGFYAFQNCTALENVKFAVTSGWYIALSTGATSGTGVVPSSSYKFIELLTDTYCGYCWLRKTS